MLLIKKLIAKVVMNIRVSLHKHSQIGVNVLVDVDTTWSFYNARVTLRRCVESFNPARRPII